MLKTGHYCISKENLLCHELIGLEVKVAKSSDAGRKSLEGKVVDETRNVLVIESKGAEKKVPKKEAEFEFMLGKETARVNGKEILFRPEQRLKALWKKRNE